MAPVDVGPFRLAGDRRGVLLLHGFAGSPYAMRFLGESLHSRGFTVWAPRLAGHGDTSAVLDATGWHDWLGTAETELAELRQACTRVAVVGLSMGGVLALRLAQTRDGLAALGVLAAPLWLPFQIRHMIGVLAGVSRIVGPLPAFPNFGGSDIRDPEAKRAYPSPPGFPVLALENLLSLMKLVRQDLPEVRIPTLCIHADHDHTAPPASAREIIARVGATDKTLIRLSRSYHIITLDVEREEVAEAVGAFLAERM